MTLERNARGEVVFTFPNAGYETLEERILLSATWLEGTTVSSSVRSYWPWNATPRCSSP